MSELSVLLETISPTIGEITSLFQGLAKMAPIVRDLFLRATDPALLQKMSTWATAFANKLNDLGPNAFNPSFIQQSLNTADSQDFFDVMKATVYVGPQLTTDDLDNASNAITSAIEGENYLKAIQIGIALGMYIPTIAAATGV